MQVEEELHVSVLNAATGESWRDGVRDIPLVLFTGSRDWNRWNPVSDTLELLRETVGPFKGLHGGARGLDTIVDSEMRARGWEVEAIKPRYDLYHPKLAPKRRNLEMLDRHPDIVVGFWTEEEGGTTHCLEFAINVYRIPVIVITC